MTRRLRREGYSLRPDPTKLEIMQAKKEIQKGWDDATRQNREGYIEREYDKTVIPFRSSLGRKFDVFSETN